MILPAVLHRPTLDYVYPRSRDTLCVRLSAAAGDLAEANVLYWGRYETEPTARRRIRMRAGLRDGMRDYFSAEIRCSGIAAYVRYCFELTGVAGERLYLGADGFKDTEPSIETGFFEFLWPNASDSPSAPEWSSEQIYYQIFPERFADGDKSLNPPGTVPWGSTPTRENFMGGDLKGIIENLDYIAELGVTCLYLTPVFAAVSNHKYDTIDYYRVDPSFGTSEDLKKLVCEAHSRSLRVIFDGVFNHSGFYWPPFHDVVENSALSRYKDWFFINSWPAQPEPCSYDCVGHYEWMPKVNLANPEVRRYFIGVGKHWLRETGADGWRLDVADEVPASFWEEFAYEIKSEFPNCVLIGETWGDAGKLVEPGRLDAAMNYLFRDAVRDWLALGKISAAEFANRANQLLSLYPYETALRMYNPLDSHDTPRFLTYCSGDSEKHALAIALQMTFPGCPAVYYGDEIGMTGENDPDCRRAMDWERAAKRAEPYDWYQRLIEFRKHSNALTCGDFHIALVDNEYNSCGYCRTYGGESVLTVINAGNETLRAEASVPENEGEWLDVFCGEVCRSKPAAYIARDAYKAEYTGTLSVTVPARSVKIFLQKRK